MDPGGSAVRPPTAPGIGLGTDLARRARLDRAARGLARLALRVFYRELEVVGLERVPAETPLVIVANHGNSLIDPALLMAVLPRLPRFLAKHTLWANPAVRPLLELAGSLPVRRSQDGGGSSGRNEDTFDRCYEELARGGCVALFPEGITYHEPQLQPVKTGAARIALGAEARHGPLGLRLLPVGLEFEDKARFRSRALAVVGEPLDPARELALAASDEAGAVRALTERVREALEGVTVNSRTWREAALLARAADLVGGAPRALPGLSPQAEHFTLRRAIAAAHRQLAERDRARARAAERIIERYDAQLARHALRDDQVTANYPWRSVAAHLLDRLPLLIVQVPAAFLGAALHVVPALCARAVGRFAASHPELPATYKLLVGLFGFPLWWLFLGLATGRRYGALAGLAVGLLSPPLGYVALRFREEYTRLLHEARAWLALRLRPGLARELRALRRAARRQLRALDRRERRDD